MIQASTLKFLASNSIAEPGVVLLEGHQDSKIVHMFAFLLSTSQASTLISIHKGSSGLKYWGMSVWIGENSARYPAGRFPYAKPP